MKPTKEAVEYLKRYLQESARHAGKSRMTSMTAEKRKEVARMGGQAKWAKYRAANSLHEKHYMGCVIGPWLAALWILLRRFSVAVRNFLTAPFSVRLIDLAQFSNAGTPGTSHGDPGNPGNQTPRKAFVAAERMLLHAFPPSSGKSYVKWVQPPLFGEPCLGSNGPKLTNQTPGCETIIALRGSLSFTLGSARKSPTSSQLTESWVFIPRRFGQLSLSAENHNAALSTNRFGESVRPRNLVNRLGLVRRGAVSKEPSLRLAIASRLANETP